MRRWTRPYTYICSTSAQKAALKVVGGLGVENLGWDRGKGVGCTGRAAFEMDWWKFGMFQ